MTIFRVLVPAAETYSDAKTTVAINECIGGNLARANRKLATYLRAAQARLDQTREETGGPAIDLSAAHKRLGFNTATSIVAMCTNIGLRAPSEMRKRLNVISISRGNGRRQFGLPISPTWTALHQYFRCREYLCKFVSGA